MPYKKCTSKKEDGRTREARAMPLKWLNVIGLMALGGLDFQAAMRTEGYSDTYYKTSGHLIKQDPRFAKALSEKMAGLEQRSEDLRKEVVKYLCTVMRDTEEATRDRNAAVKELGSINGWHSETIKHETTDRQNLLDSANRTEAARLASLALDTRQLPDRRVVQSDVVTLDSDTIVYPIAGA
jgi:hypothetical protein